MAFAGVLGVAQGYLGNFILGASANTGALFTRNIAESVTASSISVTRGLVLSRTTSESVTAAHDTVGKARTLTRTTFETIPSAIDSSIQPVQYSTFLADTPLPVYANILDANLDYVTSTTQIETRPIFKSSINGGFQPITLDLSTSTMTLQNGYIVQVYEQGGDGSILFQGVIEDLPDTYDADAVHRVTVSPMVIFLGATDYSASWVDVDVAVIMRDIVSQCPYLQFTPGSIQNVQGRGNLLSAENASFEGGSTGDWVVGTMTGVLGTALAMPGTFLLGALTNGNTVLVNTGAQSTTTYGSLGRGLLGLFTLGDNQQTVGQSYSVDGTHALQLTFIANTLSSSSLADLRISETAAAAGSVYTALISVRAATNGETWTPRLQWLDGSNNLISAVAGTPVADIEGAFTQLYVSGVAPASATRVAFTLSPSAARIGEVHYFDAASIAANTSSVWTPGFTPGAPGLATLTFTHVSALQALTTCIQSAGPTYYFFVDEIGIVWLAHLDQSVADPTYRLAQGADFSAREFNAPIDTLCNFVEVLGGNQTWQSSTTLATAIPNTFDVSLSSNAVFNVVGWNYPPDLFVILVDSEQMLCRGYGDVEISGPGDMSIRIYQRGYAGTSPAAHAIGVIANVQETPTTVPITAFYDGTNGSPRRALIPPGTYPDCYDYTTLQHIANTLGVWLNRKVVSIKLTLPAYGSKIRLNSATGQTISYWEPNVYPFLETYQGTGIPSPHYLITDVEIDGGVQTITLSDLPFSSEDLQYFVENMLQNSMVVAASALKATSTGNAIVGAPPGGTSL